MTANLNLNKLQIINVIAFIVFCIAIGQVTSALLTGLMFDLNASQIFDIVKNPAIVGRNVVIWVAVSSSLLSFLIIPVIYLLLIKKGEAVRFLLQKDKIRFTPMLLSISVIFTILPVIAILIKLNHTIVFPIWLTELENYFKRSEENARLMTGTLLSFRGSDSLILPLIVMAIIPGIVEEFFFRGIVQTQLQGIFRNQHYAVWLAAFLFSFFHFQFYGFIPRLVLGALLGYMFLWTKNIWYSCAAHIVNNAIGVLGLYHLGSGFLNAKDVAFILMMLSIPSLAVTVFTLTRLKKSGMPNVVET